MKIIVVADYEEMSYLAAARLAEQVRRKPNSVLGFATGETPVGMYRHLVAMARREGLDFSRVVIFNLDEYYGLDPRHPASYHHFMHRHLLDHVNIAIGNVHIPNGMTSDVITECQRYEEAIRYVGGIDLQVLGIGRNGHIGFNEPGTTFDSRTRLVTLAEETVRVNARFSPALAAIPRQAISMGIATILEAREILLLAAGAEKADAIAAAVLGPVTPRVPASALGLHPRVTFLLDRAAASQLGENKCKQLSRRDENGPRPFGEGEQTLRRGRVGQGIRPRDPG